MVNSKDTLQRKINIIALGGTVDFSNSELFDFIVDIEDVKSYISDSVIKDLEKMRTEYHQTTVSGQKDFQKAIGDMAARIDRIIPLRMVTKLDLDNIKDLMNIQNDNKPLGEIGDKASDDFLPVNDEQTKNDEEVVDDSDVQADTNEYNHTNKMKVPEYEPLPKNGIIKASYSDILQRYVDIEKIDIEELLKLYMFYSLFKEKKIYAIDEYEKAAVKMLHRFISYAPYKQFSKLPPDETERMTLLLDEYEKEVKHIRNSIEETMIKDNRALNMSGGKATSGYDNRPVNASRSSVSGHKSGVKRIAVFAALLLAVVFLSKSIGCSTGTTNSSTTASQHSASQSNVSSDDKLTPMAISNGRIVVYPKAARTTPMTFKTKGTGGYYIFLDSTESSQYDMAFYIEAGKTLKIDVPPKKYHMYYASGETWYGKQYKFGQNTHYAKDEELLDCEQYEYEYTLYPVENGNLETTKIDAEDFPK